MAFPCALSRGWPKLKVLGVQRRDNRWLSNLGALSRARVVCRASALVRAVHPTLSTRPQVRRDHPLNLSISISGGKETYKDSLSNGERTGNSPA